MHEALSLGVQGYVVKANAGRELFLTIETVYLVDPDTITAGLTAESEIALRTRPTWLSQLD
jgi:hypothetical protein